MEKYQGVAITDGVNRKIICCHSVRLLSHTMIHGILLFR